jgi:hypothetical protein
VPLDCALYADEFRSLFACGRVRAAQAAGHYLFKELFDMAGALNTCVALALAFLRDGPRKHLMYGEGDPSRGSAWQVWTR